METTTLHALWVEARTRFSILLTQVQPHDLSKKLPGSPNSLGFLLRHIAEVELLFAKNVFGSADLKVVAKTVIEGRDSGVWTDLESLKSLERESFAALEAAILRQTEGDWSFTVTTKEFGTKTKAEALGRIVSHTAYHAGQMAIVLKYGKA
jgi:uncharacterized damage-inducible protein DinB